MSMFKSRRMIDMSSDYGYDKDGRLIKMISECVSFGRQDNDKDKDKDKDDEIDKNDFRMCQPWLAI